MKRTGIGILFLEENVLTWLWFEIPNLITVGKKHRGSTFDREAARNW